MVASTAAFLVYYTNYAVSPAAIERVPIDGGVATVISGTWYFGYGDAFNAAALKALPAGSYYTEPPRRAHFVLEVCDDIPVAGFLGDSRSAAIATRQLTDHLTDYFSLEIHRAAS